MSQRYKVIQIVELPPNGNLTPYAVRIYAEMESFDFNFASKNGLKKFLVENNAQSGEYIIVHMKEQNGTPYVVDAVCIYRTKDSGSFLDFKLPGPGWIDLVTTVMSGAEIINDETGIQTLNKIIIPQIVNADVQNENA